jgi:hypothetical protein
MSRSLMGISRDPVSLLRSVLRDAEQNCSKISSCSLVITPGLENPGTVSIFGQPQGPRKQGHDAKPSQNLRQETSRSNTNSYMDRREHKLR